MTFLSHITRRTFLALLAVALVGLQPAASALDADSQWVGTWATGLQKPESGFATPSPASFSNQTLRQIVHTSIGGSEVRVRIANRHYGQAITIGAAHIALRASKSAIVESSDRALTFNGALSVTIPVGATVTSDSVLLDVPPLSDLAVSVYFPSFVNARYFHNVARQTNYVSSAGDHTRAVTFPTARTTDKWYLLAGVDVGAPRTTSAIVAIGSSSTDGARSTLNANRRYPDYLARRLHDAGLPAGVLNVGIAGNRVLNHTVGESALARFDRDVLRQPGVKHVILFEGLNDITRTDKIVSADEIIAGYQQLIDRARAKGLKIHGATLQPIEGNAGYNSTNEAKRQAVNKWVRESGAFDAVIDFDAVLRDPERPARLLPEYDSGDHIHPNDAGYGAMANSIDLALFQ